MKKVYETPKAVKYVFDYQENVVASSTGNGPNANPNANPHAQNNCYTHNTSDVYGHPECLEEAIPKPV